MSFAFIPLSTIYWEVNGKTSWMADAKATIRETRKRLFQCRLRYPMILRFTITLSWVAQVICISEESPLGEISNAHPWSVGSALPHHPKKEVLFVQCCQYSKCWVANLEVILSLFETILYRTTKWLLFQCNIQGESRFLINPETLDVTPLALNPNLSIAEAIPNIEMPSRDGVQRLRKNSVSAVLP